MRYVDELTCVLTRHCVTALRIAVGIVFLAFGTLKLQPGASPAEAIAIRTVDTLTFGVVHGQAALLVTAEMEIFIGITLTLGWCLRAGLVVLAVALVGILSPLVLFPGELFHGGVTLTAQYVFKDIVIAAAGMVLGAHSLGSRLVTEHDVAAERQDAAARREREMDAARARFAPRRVTHSYSVRSNRDRESTPS